MDVELFELYECTSMERDDTVAGRVKIVMSCLKIHNNLSEYNANGMTWVKKYVEDNLQSAIGMPFVVRYLDDEREIISDHGRMENDLEDGELVFPDSDTVGYVESAWIEDKEINGIIEPIMMVSGYIYDQRHHNLVKWLRKRHNDNEKIKGSIEVSPKGKNKSIVYENGKFNDDGTLKMGRKAQVFDFSGICLLNDEIGISPSDVASELVEVNNKITNVNALDNIDDKNNKEVNVNMDEKILELQAEIIDLQSKLENKTDEFEKVNAELNSLKQADELNVCKAELDDVKAELNSCKEELETIKTEKAELNEAIVVAQKEVTAKDTVIAELNSELLPLKEAKELAEKEELKAEVNNAYKKIEDENGFTEEELAELNSFVENVDMDGLKAKESEICAKKFKEERIAKKLETEVNSNIIKDEENSSLGLFFSTKVEKDSTELNNVGDDKDGSKLFFEQ